MAPLWGVYLQGRSGVGWDGGGGGEGTGEGGVTGGETVRKRDQ